jgi:deoxyribose-phosphate aldolase
MTTIDTLTDSQIETLRDEAGAAGDVDMVVICDAALAGDTEALRRVVAAIRDAEAQG